MSFYHALPDAQHEALEMDEAFAFLDGFDLSTPCDHLEGTASSSHLPTNDCSSSWSSRSDSCCSDELTSASPDVSLFTQLAESATCETLGADWEGALQTLNQRPPTEPSQLQTEPQRLTQPPQKNKKTNSTKTRSSATVPKTKKPRKDNRIEILKLRELVEQLQARYSELQRLPAPVEGRAVSVSVSAALAAQFTSRGETKKGKTIKGADSTSTTAAPPRSVWFDLAKEQCKQRLHSEGLNRKLRDAVTKQLKVTKSLQALLQKKVSPQDLAFLLEAPPLPPPANLQNTVLDPQELIRTALYRSAERYFHETDRVCQGISVANNVTSVFTTSSTKQDSVRGPTFELMTNTPVPCNFQLIGQLMWTRAIEMKDPSVVRSLSELQLTKAHFSRGFHEKRVQMVVPSKFGELQLEGVIVVCKFEEAHRIVMTVASAYTMNDTSFVFREDAWIVVSEAQNSTKNQSAGREGKRQPWEPSPFALFQTLFRIHSEKRDPMSSTGSSPFTNAPDEKTEDLRQVVANVLGDHMRQHMAVLQKSLLSEVETLASSMMEFNCPLAACTC